MEAAQVAEEMGNDSGGGDEFFYEEIEAPKYVDFTAPDHYNPDDRYWFCSRVGCDQKHEEELDLEEINKNFVLRVMAARSPNVRLRKALTAKTMDSARKCPLTAPPKPSRTRVSRLAVLSSISRKLLDGKERVKPVRPLTVTPNPKGKKPTVVALTTPRYKTKVLKPEVFRSVRNPKKEEAAVSEKNTRVVAKALLFHSPKELVKKKTASDMDASVRKICTGMKKLEINGQRKNILGYDNKSLNTGASKKKLGAREVKSRVYDTLKSQKCKKPQENGASKFMEKEECEKELQKCVTSEGCDGSSGESSDMEVDENSNRGSLENCSTESELFEVPIVQDALDDLRNKLTVQVEMLLPSSDSNSSDPSENPLSAKEKDDNVETVKSVAEEDGSPKGDNLNDTGDRENSEREGDDKENASIVNYNRDQNAVSENDDKENTSALDDNRQQNREPSGNILGRQDKHGKKQLKARVISKPSQEAGVDTKSGQVGKYTKPKPTNPKPFRLRTDERRILKEANLEKKLLEPSKAANPTAFPGLSGGNPPKKHHNTIKNESLTSQNKEGSSHQRDEMKRREGAFILQQRRIPILSPQTPTQESMKRKKLPLKGQSQRVVPGKRPEIRQLSVIKETSKLEDRPTETPKLNEVKAKAVNSPIASGESRSSSSHSRRRPTVPKEPNFHSVHVPRSCTSKLVGAN